MPVTTLDSFRAGGPVGGSASTGPNRHCPSINSVGTPSPLASITRWWLISSSLKNRQLTGMPNCARTSRIYTEAETPRGTSGPSENPRQCSSHDSSAKKHTSTTLSDNAVLPTMRRRAGIRYRMRYLSGDDAYGRPRIDDPQAGYDLVRTPAARYTNTGATGKRSVVVGSFCSTSSGMLLL
jgi:hypothetical protein